MTAWGRLLRLSLAPSAAADVLAGAVVVSAGLPSELGRLALVILGALCVYHGGMALNDWADRAEDARLRPERPLPRGEIAAPAALLVALALLAAGPALSALASTHAGALHGLVVLGAVVYDLVGRGAWRGPLLLATCRMGNLAAGMALAAHGREPQAAWLLVLLLYGAYVFCVSRVGRLEDREGPLGRAPRAWILAALLALALVATLPLPQEVRPSRRAVVAVVLLLALAHPLYLALRAGDWSRARVLQSMGMLLRRLLAFTAALALLAGGAQGWLAAGLIACGWPLAFALRKLYPPS